ncbi:hypothetical protein BGW39_000059 [Mortierella sp. 14UC]|nr:hypothetical protein BGW39_000059 [Mortierella sp. 14UC]
MPAAMTDVPKILSAIGHHLNINSLLACTAVCRQWNAVFTPFIWHDFDNSRKLWRHLVDPRVAKMTGSSTEVEDTYIDRQERLTALMRQHNQRIHDMTIKDKMVLIAALDAPLTGLHSLTIELEIWELDDGEDSDVNKSNTWISTMLEMIAEKSPLESLVPESAFVTSLSGDARLDWTRACWLMVFMNSALRRLTFGGYSTLRYINALATQSTYGGPLAVAAEVAGEGAKMPILTKVSELFLVDTISRLPRLRHLKMGMRADNFIFRNLNTLLPNLESFVYVERAYLDVKAIQLASPHQSLRVLDFQQVLITAGQLRAIIVAFPVLQHLSSTQDRSDIYRVNHDKYNNLDKATSFQTEEVLKHNSLTTLSIRHQPYINILHSRIRFSRITRIDRSIPVKNAYELRQLLWTFPALQLFESEYELGERVPLRADEVVHEGRNYPIRSLSIYTSSFFMSDLDSVIAQMPLLERLEISGGSFDGSVLTELARTCSNLRYAQFDVSEECSQQLNALFVGCSKLKECLGKGHRVRVEDVINGPEWTCHGVEKVDLKIVGIPRLSSEQEEALEMVDQQETEEGRRLLELREESRRVRSIIKQRTGRLVNFSRFSTTAFGLGL